MFNPVLYFLAEARCTGMMQCSNRLLLLTEPVISQMMKMTALLLGQLLRQQISHHRMHAEPARTVQLWLNKQVQA